MGPPHGTARRSVPAAVHECHVCRAPFGGLDVLREHIRVHQADTKRARALQAMALLAAAHLRELEARDALQESYDYRGTVIDELAARIRSLEAALVQGGGEARFV